MVKPDEWVVECWVDDEFDYSTTFETYEQALDKLEDEVKFYKGLATGSVDTWAVKLYEIEKTLVMHDESISDDG